MLRVHAGRASVLLSLLALLACWLCAYVYALLSGLELSRPLGRLCVAYVVRVTCCMCGGFVCSASHACVASPRMHMHMHMHMRRYVRCVEVCFAVRGRGGLARRERLLCASSCAARVLVSVCVRACADVLVYA